MRGWGPHLNLGKPVILANSISSTILPGANAARPFVVKRMPSPVQLVHSPTTTAWMVCSVSGNLLVAAALSKVKVYGLTRIRYINRSVAWTLANYFTRQQRLHLPLLNIGLRGHTQEDRKMPPEY